MIDDKVYATKSKCAQCGVCCTKAVCDLGISLMATNVTPCPALEYKDGKSWCGMVTNTEKHVLPGLNPSPWQAVFLREHVLRVNNFGEGCDFEEWMPIPYKEEG